MIIIIVLFLLLIAEVEGVMAPQLAVATGYGPQTTFDTPVPLGQVPFPDVLPLPRALLAGSTTGSSSMAAASSTVIPPSSDQLTGEVVLPAALAAAAAAGDAVFLSHPSRDVFDLALRRYSATANEALTALHRGDLVSSTLPRNLHLQSQLPNNQQMSVVGCSSRGVYTGAATLGRPSRECQPTQKPGVRWNPSVQMIPPTSMECPSSQVLKEAS